MKKIILLLITTLYTISGFSQDTTGLIAHWKFNGNALDASGHGHDGITNNTAIATGKGGTSGTALAFNGLNSYVYVPYNKAFNVTKLSICATVKVQGYYRGDCQGNIILVRGAAFKSTAGYNLGFDDNQYDSSCSNVDTTKDCFFTTGGVNFGTYYKTKEYTPTIVENQWYSVVGIFDSNAIIMYVNGVLKYIAPTSAIPMDSSTDGIYIGMNVLDSVSYPYSFKGIIDDIKLYNRALTSADIAAYDTSTLAIPTANNEPTGIYVYPNPAKSDIYINIEGTGTGNISILNQLGQVLLTRSITNHNEKLDVSGLPPGIYFINIQHDNHVINKKFLKE